MVYERIFKICRKQKRSIRSVEREAGIRYGVIPKWKTSDPTVGNLLKVAKALGVSITDLAKAEDYE